ncbi:MAG: thioredoxin family protein [Thiohalospira sp.]
MVARIITVCSLLFLFAASVAAQEEGEVHGGGEFSLPGWFKVSFLDLPADLAEAREEDRGLILFWEQEGCPYCEALIETNFHQRDIVDYTRANFDVVALNLRGDRPVTTLDGEQLGEKALAEEMEVQFTPTLLFLDDEGEPILRLNGYYPPEEFRVALEYVGEGAWREEDFATYMAEHGPGEAAEPGFVDQPFLAEPPHDLSGAEGPLAILFEQRRCPECRRVHDEILDDPRARERLEPFHVVRLDRWGDETVTTPEGEQRSAREWADELEVTYTPTMVLFDGQREVIRMESHFRGFHVRSMLDYVATGAWEEEPRFQRYIDQRSQRLRERGEDVDLWEEK